MLDYDGLCVCGSLMKVFLSSTKEYIKPFEGLCIYLYGPRLEREGQGQDADLWGFIYKAFHRMVRLCMIMHCDVYIVLQLFSLHLHCISEVVICDCIMLMQKTCISKKRHAIELTMDLR